MSHAFEVELEDNEITHLIVDMDGEGLACAISAPNLLEVLAVGR